MCVIHRETSYETRQSIHRTLVRAERARPSLVEIGTTVGKRDERDIGAAEVPEPGESPILARMTDPGSGPATNRLLAVLPAIERERVYPGLELVSMPLGRVLYESGSQLDHVYFPTDSIVSLLYVMADGASAEIAVVGNDGMVGVALFMGGETTPSRAVVQSAGVAYRLSGSAVKDEFRRGGAMQHLLLRYTQALLTQMAQTAVCNRHHSVDQQLCRWLLLSLDRLSSNELKMTQELIANMLGVRREGVTEAAGKLQAAGVIRYSRGRITVLDRAALEAHACECYAVVRQESERLLPRVNVG
jgi:CRP-like cAMP-binding protein